jgi:alkaline phosphatase D
MAELRSSRVCADLRAHSLLESQFDRRRFLKMLGGVAATAALAQLPADRATAATQPRLDYPFTLGIASGDPRPDGVVLWTRLAPEPFSPGGGMPPQPRVPVAWKVARDPGMRRVVRSGTAFAIGDLAHTVHIEVAGL